MAHVQSKKNKTNQMENRLEEKSKQLLQSVNKLREQLSKVPDMPQSELTKLGLRDLKIKLNNKETTPTQLLHAFQANALESYDKGNSGICEFIHEAEEQARQLELPECQKETKDCAPLYGIPVSLKELLPVRGYDATIGLVKRCGEPAEKDCVLVQTLRAEGAIPFLITATTQCARVLTGTNPIFGDMTNPQSERHEPGGSSCGEGVVLSHGVSIVGFGTDLGGSVRIPAAFCGLAGLKPTSNRMSIQGMINFDPKSVMFLKHVAGPMARKVDTLADALRTVLRPSMFNLDPSVVPLPFQESVYNDEKKLTIGYYLTFDDVNIIQAGPSMRNATQRAVDILRNQGHTLIPFSPPNSYWALEMSLRCVSVDNGDWLKQFLSEEPLGVYLKEIKEALSKPRWYRNMLDKKMERSIGKVAALVHTFNGPESPKELMELHHKMVTYRSEFLKVMEQTDSLDAIVCPAWPYPALAKQTPSSIMNPSIIYTILYNLLDFPAGTVPFGHVTETDVEETKEEAKRLGREGNHYQQSVLELQVNDLGLSTGVQVVAKPYHEEVVLRIMRELENSSE